MKIRAEINEISIQETKIYQRSQKIIYLKINIINKSLARLSKKKQRSHKLSVSEMKDKSSE